jgi:L-amino acid N-acyltransferase YncA
MQALVIREIEPWDWPSIWPIIEDVVRAADTFAYDPALNEQDAKTLWIERPPGLTVVVADDGAVLATAKMGPNRPGPARHIATASFMVAAAARGRGVGTQLLQFAIVWAKQKGYAGMQFNAVAASNTRAVDLYRRFGFEVVGTVPGAFEQEIAEAGFTA